MPPARSLSVVSRLLPSSLKSSHATALSTFPAASAIFALIAALAASSALRAQEPAETPSSAPLNPRFADYIENRTHVELARPAFTREGHPLGYIPSTVDFSHLKGQPALAELQGGNLPSSYDLRNYNKVSPVKNQLRCGDCWAFATYGSMESVLLTGESWNFSENNLNNLNGFDYGVCQGGNGQMSTAYLARWAGPVNASADPDPTSCTSQSTCYNPSPRSTVPQKHVQGVIFIAPRASATDNANLKSAIMTYGGVQATISADELGGDNSYWNPSTDAYYYNGAKVCKDSKGKAAECGIDHAITLVGWNDDFPAANFATAPAGNGAFLVKNSWGTDFGSGGYFWISYYDAQFAYQESYVYDDNENTTSYTTEYEYDPLGLVSSIGYSVPTAWAANIFTAKANGQLLAVSTYALSNGTAYTVEIYTNALNGPTSGTLAITVSGTLPLAGYKTIELPSPVAIKQGQKFSVVMKLTTPGLKYPIPYQFAEAGYSSQATAKAGQGFISFAGTSWQDATTFSSTMSVNLKAFSNDLAVQVAPGATTGAASALTAASATLAATVNPNGADTHFWFVYGTSSTLSGASQTNSKDLGSGTNASNVSIGISGLNAATKYYFRIVANNSAGTVNGAINSFTTLAKAPTVSTGAASALTATSATLAATVNPNGADTHYWFLFGTSSTLSGATLTVSRDLGSGVSASTITAKISGLRAATKYYFKLVAQNSAGTVSGAINSFTCASAK